MDLINERVELTKGRKEGRSKIKERLKKSRILSKRLKLKI